MANAAAGASALPEPSTKPAGASGANAPHETPERPGFVWPDPWLSLGALALYVALERLSFLHQHDGLPVTPWNPGLGLMLALIIARGAGYAAVLFLGVVLAEILVLRSELPAHVIVAVGAIIALVYGAVAIGVRRHLELDQDLFRTRDILLLSGASLAGAVVVSALLSAVLLSISFFDVSDVARTAAPLVLGDLIGIVVVTPLLLRAFAQKGRIGSVSLATVAEFAAYAVAVAAVLVVTTWRGSEQHHLFYLLFLPVVVAAVRHGIDGSCAVLAAVQLLLVALLHQQGLDLSLFTEYQFRMLVLTLTGLVVGSLVRERQLADQRAKAAAAKLEALQAEAARVARLNLVSGMAAALAHEVNQPLTAARALARSVQQLVSRPDKDLARAEANIATMIEQVDHAGAIVRRIREFLRRGEPHTSTHDLRTVLEEAIALVQPQVKSLDCTIRLELPDDPPPVFADRVQLQQVIINLVRNGLEAIGDSGRSGGAIVVSAAAAGQEIEISVEDNGTGIDAEALPTLFEPLSTSRPDGIGLGLSICRTIVQAHGGRIWLASSVPGRTVFRFSLPAGRAGSIEG